MRRGDKGRALYGDTLRRYIFARLWVALLPLISSSIPAFAEGVSAPAAANAGTSVASLPHDGWVESRMRQLISDGVAIGRNAPGDLLTAASAPINNPTETALLLAGLGGLMLLDQPIRGESQDHLDNLDRDLAHDHAHIISPGHEMALSLWLYGAGWLSGWRPLRETGRDAIEALLLTDGVTSLLKYAAGRERPSGTENAFHFDPAGDDTSFPSGHAASAFALATVIARHTQRRGMTLLAYSLAASVAAARVAENVHWTSDVVAGALLGTGFGWIVSAPHVSALGHDLEIGPAPNGAGVAVQMHF